MRFAWTFVIWWLAFFPSPFPRQYKYPDSSHRLRVSVCQREKSKLGRFIPSGSDVITAVSNQSPQNENETSRYPNSILGQITGEVGNNTQSAVSDFLARAMELERTTSNNKIIWHPKGRRKGKDWPEKGKWPDISNRLVTLISGYFANWRDKPDLVRFPRMERIAKFVGVLPRLRSVSPFVFVESYTCGLWN